MYDFRFVQPDRRSNIALLTPVSQDAGDWCELHIPSDATRWGSAYVVEARYASDILEGIANDGLSIA